MSKALVITKGHPFDKNAFFAVFDALVADPECELTDYTNVEQPAALSFFDPARAEPWDVFVMYDMPGITFSRSEPYVVPEQPSDDFMAGAISLLELGKGMVFLHHTIAGWPAWDGWAHVLGGRFHYQPGLLDGVEYPDSGYRHEVTHTVKVVDSSHPIVAGLPEEFEITDEVYLAPILEGAVDPLLRSSHTFSDDNFYSANLAVHGKKFSKDGWSHPLGSNLVGWTKHAGNSPVVYLQFGDGPETYADSNYRRVLGNSIDWAASARAHSWARARRWEKGNFA